MSFDPRTPFEIHYVEEKSGDQMVECHIDEAEMEERARALISRAQARAGSVSLYHVSRRRIGLGR